MKELVTVVLFTSKVFLYDIILISVSVHLSECVFYDMNTWLDLYMGLWFRLDQVMWMFGRSCSDKKNFILLLHTIGLFTSYIALQHFPCISKVLLDYLIILNIGTDNRWNSVVQVLSTFCVRFSFSARLLVFLLWQELEFYKRTRQCKSYAI